MMKRKMIDFIYHCKNEVITVYYPKQIPYILDCNFKHFVNYHEIQVNETNDITMCIWTMKSKHAITDKITNQILPDACIDLVIDFVKREICFAGYSKESEPFPLYQNIDYMGVRLKPGAFYALYHIDANLIMDHMIPYAEIESTYDLDAVFDCVNEQERISLIQAYLSDKLKSQPKLDFIRLADELYASPKDQNVILTAERLGYNQRQLLRIFHKHYGVSPKVLLNILRLHLCLTMLQNKDTKIDLADIAAQCGFYDQPHFIKEIKRYTGISPLKLLTYD